MNFHAFGMNLAEEQLRSEYQAAREALVLRRDRISNRSKERDRLENDIARLDQKFREDRATLERCLF